MNAGACRQPGRAGRVLRPANLQPVLPAMALYEGTTHSGVDYAVIDLQGCVFMNTTNHPSTLLTLLAGIQAKVSWWTFTLRPTSEKVAMGWHLDGPA